MTSPRGVMVPGGSTEADQASVSGSTIGSRSVNWEQIDRMKETLEKKVEENQRLKDKMADLEEAISGKGLGRGQMTKLLWTKLDERNGKSIQKFCQEAFRSYKWLPLGWQEPDDDPASWYQTLLAKVTKPEGVGDDAYFMKVVKPSANRQYIQMRSKINTDTKKAVVGNFVLRVRRVCVLCCRANTICTLFSFPSCAIRRGHQGRP